MERLTRETLKSLWAEMVDDFTEEDIETLGSPDISGQRKIIFC
jgi:hypothetical protein